jgi:hypothetical protein
MINKEIMAESVGEEKKESDADGLQAKGLI